MRKIVVKIGHYLLIFNILSPPSWLTAISSIFLFPYFALILSWHHCCKLLLQTLKPQANLHPCTTQQATWRMVPWYTYRCT